MCITPSEFESGECKNGPWWSWGRLFARRFDITPAVGRLSVSVPDKSFSQRHYSIGIHIMYLYVWMYGGGNIPKRIQKQTPTLEPCFKVPRTRFESILSDCRGNLNKLIKLCSIQHNQFASYVCVFNNALWLLCVWISLMHSSMVLKWFLFFVLDNHNLRTSIFFRSSRMWGGVIN